MAYTTPSTWVAGAVLTAAQLNTQLRDNIRFLHGVPTCRLRRDAAQALASGSWDTVQWDTEDWDNNTIWSSTNNDQLFVRTAGKYNAIFVMGFATSTGGTVRAAALVKNSTALALNDDAWTFSHPADKVFGVNNLTVSGMFSMTTSDYLTGQFFQDAGAINSSTTVAEQPRIAIFWVSS